MKSPILPYVPSHRLPDMMVAEARVTMAEQILRLDLRVELLRHGATPTEAELSAMLDGIPREIYYQLIAERT